jgi:hypothetical protein
MADKKQETEPNSTPSEESGDTEEEQLFDLLIPPGVPLKIITDITQKFDVQVVARKERLYFANMDGDERELLAFRGRREVMEKVQDYLFAEMKKFIEE